MTAAELATAMATQGAAEHRAEGERETIPDYWTGSLLTGLDFKADSRFGWTEPGDCEQRSPDESLGCTRNLNHPGRHIATCGDHVMAAWPGTHEPTLADLDDPQPEPDTTKPTAEVITVVQDAPEEYGARTYRESWAKEQLIGEATRAAALGQAILRIEARYDDQPMSLAAAVMAAAEAFRAGAR